MQPARPRIAVWLVFAALASCGGAQRPRAGDARTAYAAPVVATSRTGEPRNIACSADDAAAARTYRTVPPQQLEGDFVVKPLPQLAEGEGGLGQYLIAADVDGHVAEVRTFQTIPGNLAIAAALCQWKLKPQQQPVRAVLLLGFKPIPRRFR